MKKIVLVLVAITVAAFCEEKANDKKVMKLTLEEAKKIYESLEAEDLIREAYEKREIRRFDCAGIVASKFGTRENTEMLAGENGKLLTGE